MRLMRRIAQYTNAATWRWRDCSGHGRRGATAMHKAMQQQSEQAQDPLIALARKYLGSFTAAAQPAAGRAVTMIAA